MTTPKKKSTPKKSVPKKARATPVTKKVTSSVTPEGQMPAPVPKNVPPYTEKPDFLRPSPVVKKKNIFRRFFGF